MRLLFLSLFIFIGLSLSAQWHGKSDAATALNEKSSVGSGLDVVVLFYGMENAELTYQSSSTSTMEFYTFNSQGTGTGLQPVTQNTEQNGTVGKFTNISPNKGYAIKQNGNWFRVWVINYQEFPLTLNNIAVAEEQNDECSEIRLSVQGNSPQIPYYTVSGQRQTLKRSFELNYQTMQWDEASQSYTETPFSKTIETEYIHQGIVTSAPLCNTTFQLTGDQYLTQWGMAIEQETPTYQAISVQAHSLATQKTKDAQNEVGREPEFGKFGGSAPVEIKFEAFANQPTATYMAWQFSSKSDFSVIDATYKEKELNHTFRTFGETFIRLVVANASGTCQDTTQTYTVQVTESMLKAPNAFSPHNNDGINDQWKVAYKSIIRFECSIFNRMGQLLFTSKDPSQGWSGKINGKVVPPGVYFYVISAEGADGIKYKLKGDINIFYGR